MDLLKSPNLNFPAAPTRKAHLSMTDFGFLFAVGLALMFVVTEGYDWIFERVAITKHLPLAFAVLALLLTLAGWRMFRPLQRPLRVLPLIAPFMAFSGIVILGSLIARIHLKEQNTFLFAGLDMMGVPLAATMLLRADYPRHLLRSYFGILLIASIPVFFGLAINYGVAQVYHELEFLIPPLAIYAAFAAPKRWLRWLGVLFYLVAAFLYKKNTGYLAMLLILAYLTWFHAWPRWKQLKDVRKAATFYGLAMSVLALMLVITYVWMHRDIYLPTGNVNFRELTYERALSKFKDSPLWGTVFTGASTEKFEAFNTGVARNILPTHSDILDILAQGGLIGIALWLWGLARIGRLAWRTLLNPALPPHPLTPFAHALACMSLAGVLVYSFNPIFLQPAKSLLLWINLGLLAGAATLAQQDRQKEWDLSTKPDGDRQDPFPQPRSSHAD